MESPDASVPVTGCLHSSATSRGNYVGRWTISLSAVPVLSRRDAPMRHRPTSSRGRSWLLCLCRRSSHLSFEYVNEVFSRHYHRLRDYFPLNHPEASPLSKPSTEVCVCPSKLNTGRRERYRRTIHNLRFRSASFSVNVVAELNMLPPRPTSFRCRRASYASAFNAPRPSPDDRFVAASLLPGNLSR